MSCFVNIPTNAKAKRIARRSCENTGNLNCVLPVFLEGLKNLFYVRNTNDSGPDSLRECIIKSNNACIHHIPNMIIIVAIGTINLLSALPVITRETTIITVSELDNINNNYSSVNLVPTIKINCNNYRGLLINTSSVTINGIEITNATGFGVYLNNSRRSQILNCYIHDNNGDGIKMYNSTHNIIGSNPTNNSSYFSNTITNNSINGINLETGSNNNVIQNNSIGVYQNLQSGNSQNGIYINNSDFNTIGGPVYTNSVPQTNNPTGSEGKTTPVFIRLPLANCISGNTLNGIFNYNSIQTNIYGNFIGTDYTGTTAIPNGNDGIFVQNSQFISIVGCSLTTEAFVYYNVISGNNGNGIEITDSTDIKVQGNFIGINATNDSELSNNLNGILINGESNTVIGGPVPLGNVITGNAEDGIHVTDNSDCITYNTFGGVFAFDFTPIVNPSQQNGLYIDTIGNVTVGYYLQDNSRTNLFSGNAQNGIKIAGDASGNIIGPVYCGLGSNGQAPIPNGINGLLICDNASYNTVSTDVKSLFTTNVFSANVENGIEITDNAHHNTIWNAFVGTCYLDLTSIPNGTNGIAITGNANNNTINNGNPSIPNPLPNTIVANVEYGVYIEPVTAKNNIVQYNFIGVRQTQPVYLPLPNGSGPYNLDADPSNTISNNTVA